MKFFTLALAGLVALLGLPALAMPGTTQAGSDKPTFANTASIKYHCRDEGTSIMQCQNTNTGGCEAIAKCLSKCREVANGVWCSNTADSMAPPPTQPERKAVLVKNDVDIQSDDKPHKMCTADHMGVMTCRGGFCYVAPGDLCRPGKTCHDNCACCKKH